MMDARRIDLLGLARPSLAWALAFLLLAFAPGCEQPPVIPTQDHQQNTLTSRIEGQVVVQGSARGNAVVFLYDAARPPPPAGTGRPLSFTFIPGSRLYGDAYGDGSGGPFVAPYTFSLVPPGRYLIRGFIDHDECGGAGGGGCRAPDFNPWFNVTAEPNRGDVGGAAVDAVTLQSRVLVIEPGTDGSLAPLTGVPVSFVEEATFPVDRPSFSTTATSGFVPTVEQPYKVIDLSPTPVIGGPVDQRGLFFLAKYYDDDGDGTPEGFWPKVVVRKLDARDPSNLTDENDLDRDGVLDETGQDYVHAEAPADGKPDLVVLAAGISPAPIQAVLNDGAGLPKRDPVTGDFLALPVPSLQVVVQAMALDASNPAAPEPLQSLPPGRYAITLISLTGQTWRLPNELAPAVAGNMGLPAVESQGYFLEVPAAP